MARYCSTPASTSSRWVRLKRSSPRPSPVSPQVHRGGQHELRPAGLAEYLGLEGRTAVGQEDVRAGAERLGQHRVEVAEDVEVDLQSIAGVHVLVVAALPAEGLAGQRRQ